MTVQGLWKPDLTQSDPQLQVTLQQLSNWLKVPWRKMFGPITFDHASFTSGTPTAISTPSASMIVNKVRDDTRLIFDVHTSSYSHGANGDAVFYVRLAHTDGTIYGPTSAARLYISTANTRQAASGVVQFDGMKRGRYTLLLYWSVVGTFTCNTGDSFRVAVAETLPDVDD